MKHTGSKVERPREWSARQFCTSGRETNWHERHTVDELARVLQIAVDDVTVALRVVERLDLVGSHLRLVGGKGMEFWQVWWHRAERRKYCF